MGAATSGGFSRSSSPLGNPRKRDPPIYQAGTPRRPPCAPRYLASPPAPARCAPFKAIECTPYFDSPPRCGRNCSSFGVVAAALFRSGKDPGSTGRWACCPLGENHPHGLACTTSLAIGLATPCAAACAQLVALQAAKGTTGRPLMRTHKGPGRARCSSSGRASEIRAAAPGRCRRPGHWPGGTRCSSSGPARCPAGATGSTAGHPCTPTRGRAGIEPKAGSFYLGAIHAELAARIGSLHPPPQHSGSPSRAGQALTPMLGAWCAVPTRHSKTDLEGQRPAQGRAQWVGRGGQNQGRNRGSAHRLGATLGATFRKSVCFPR
jgi:hypothetical protein